MSNRILLYLSNETFLFDFIYILWYNLVVEFKLKNIKNKINIWGLYGKKPADFIRSPESEFYAGNEEILQQELDYTVDTRVEKGVWGITWSWFDNNEKYPKEFAISENWWKAAVAIEKVRLLKNFGRIE